MSQPDPTDIRQAIAAHDQMVRQEGGQAIGDQPKEEVYVGRDPAEEEEAEHNRLKELERRLEIQERLNVSQREELEQAFAFVKRVAEQGGNVTREAKVKEEREQRRRLSAAMLEGLRARGGNVIVLVHPDPDPKRNWPVPLTHNGHRILVPRGKPVSMHHKFVECLENAICESSVPMLDHDENPVMTHIDQHSYPYTLVNNMPVERPDVQVLG